MDNNLRATVDTGVLDTGGFNSPGVLYDSEQAFMVKLDADRAFFKLRRALGYASPMAGVTADDIKAAAALLKIDLTE